MFAATHRTNQWTGGKNSDVHKIYVKGVFAPVISIVRQLSFNSTVEIGRAKQMNVHEEQFAHSFITPEKRDRYLSLLDSKRGRKKLRDGLYHCHDLDSRFAHLVPSGEQSAKSIERVLKSKGAPDKCYIFSADDEFDGREMPLSEALSQVVGFVSGTFISCIAGKLGYFEFEDMNERYILEK